MYVSISAFVTSGLKTTIYPDAASLSVRSERGSLNPGTDVCTPDYGVTWLSGTFRSTGWLWLRLKSEAVRKMSHDP